MPTYPNRYYYLGPWQLKTEDIGPVYNAPDHTVGLVDMRPVVGPTSTYGFFSTDQLLADSDYIYLGDDLNSDLTGLQVDAWKTSLNMSSVNGIKLIDVLWDTLTENADPDGEVRNYPIIPTHLGVLELHLGGHSLIKSRQFLGEQDKSWTVIQKVLQKDFRDISKAVDKDSDIPAKVLGAWKIKFKISDEGLFIPDDLPKIKAKKPTTSVSDDFNRADDPDDLGANWTIDDGEYNIVSNEAHGLGAGRNHAHHNTSLSSSDNFAQADVRDNTSISSGQIDSSVTCRQTTAQNMYEVNFNVENAASTSGYKLRKFVSTSVTNIDLAASGFGPKTIKVGADGSTIKGYVDSVEVLSATDTSVTTGITVGMFGSNGRGFHDNFSGGDLITPPAGRPLPQRVLSGCFGGPFNGVF